MTRITINPFDHDSVVEAYRKVKGCREKLRRDVEEFVRRLAAEGLEVARIRFDEALASYDGDKTPITVTVEQKGASAKLVASGRTVAFLEFGTGVSHPEHSSGLFPHGSYGYGLGKLRSWRYPASDGGEAETTGNDPAEAMTGAVQAMSERAAQIAREVFSQ